MSNNYLNSLLNNYNNYIEFLPQTIFADRFNNNNNILYRSLYDEPPILNVISNNVENKLEEINYNSKKCKNDTCPITFISFNENDKVIVLDCSHCFEPEAIKKWLKEHKAECPICRYKLESIEIKNNNNNNNTNNTNNNNNNNNIDYNTNNNNDEIENIYNIIYNGFNNRSRINNRNRFNNRNNEISYIINNMILNGDNNSYDNENELYFINYI